MRFLERKTAGVAPEPVVRASVRGEIKRKIVPLSIKADSIDENARTFSGIAAAFTLDQGGDIIVPGAFKRTIADWKRSKGGRVIQLIDTHNYFSGISVIGKMIEAAETADGLEGTFEFLSDDPTADAIYRRVKQGLLNGLSIGYETIESRAPSEEQRKAGAYRLLKEVKLLEVSVVAFPMNIDARINGDSVKSFLAGLNRDSLTDATREELGKMRDEISALLEAAPEEEPSAPPAELAPESPKRLQMAETLRRLQLVSLSE